MKIHIDIRDGIDPEDAIRRVAHVVQKGKISNNGKNYCWCTTWKDNIMVTVNNYRKSECFVVQKFIENDIQINQQ